MVLPDCIRVIQGDGINYESIKEILDVCMKAGFSADNIAFGMGGGLLQQVNRDTQKFAMKASAVCINGEWIDVFKDPITDKGKISKKGRLMLYGTKEKGFFTGQFNDPSIQEPEALETVYLNGQITKQITFEEVRKNADL